MGEKHDCFQPVQTRKRSFTPFDGTWVGLKDLRRHFVELFAALHNTVLRL